MTDPEDPVPDPAGPKQAKEQVALYAKALELNPYMTPAIYKRMAMTSRFTNDPKKTKSLFAQFQEDQPGIAPTLRQAQANPSKRTAKWASTRP